MADNVATERLSELVQESRKRRRTTQPDTDTNVDEIQAEKLQRKKDKKLKRLTREEKKAKKIQQEEEEKADKPKKLKLKAEKKDEKKDVEEEEVELQPLLPPKLSEENATKSRSTAKPVTRSLPFWITNSIKFESILHGATELPSLDSLPLNQALLDELHRQEVAGYFPVQATVIPEIIRGYSLPMHPGDLCISAPTGSGKTLAYVLPILHCLHSRVIRRIRAVVVLPNRDLVSQVKTVFDQYAQCLPVCGAEPQNRRIRIAALSGQVSFAKEQSSLVNHTSATRDSAILADVVVATPGRLVEHIHNTPGFTLQHVQFLVVDEADRLLAQSYNEWLPTFLEASHCDSLPELPPWMDRVETKKYSLRSSSNTSLAASRAAQGSWLQKLLFSATLTHDPEQLAALNLSHPRLYVAQAPTQVGDNMENGSGEDDMSQFTTPATLSEHMIICGAATKPLVLLHCLLKLKFERTLIFTSSKESTFRLCTLLQTYGGISCEQFSSSLKSNERRSIIERFKAGELQVVVCSDALARGMDLDGVANVISYDPPLYPRTYIHRIGRTARAGAKGATYTLLRRQELRHFKQLRSSINNKTLPLLSFKADDYKPFEEGYSRALESLERLIKGSKEQKSLTKSLTKVLANKIRAQKL